MPPRLRRSASPTSAWPALAVTSLLPSERSRAAFLAAFEHRLSDQAGDAGVTAAIAATLIEGGDMNVSDIVHRLTLRMRAAENDSKPHVAADLKLAIDKLVELDREAQLHKPFTPTAQVADRRFRA